MKLFRVLGKRGRITIPYELRQKVGFRYNDILSFAETKDGNAVIVSREKICDSCKDVSLQDFLENLSEEQQNAALAYLSVQWAEKQGGK